MQYISIGIRRVQESVVIIALPKGNEKVTPEIIAAAAAATLQPEEWDTEGDLEIVRRVPMDAETAEEFHCYSPFTGANQTWESRAEEIGVSVVTLRKWRDQHGVEVFDDASVKAHVGRQRCYNPRIAAKFKARLSGA